MADERILAFLCNWCSYGGADLAGGMRLDVPDCVRVVRVMCSGRVDAQMVLEAFRDGADGVLILGCHPGDCHYRTGNLNARNRAHLLAQLLEQLGIARERFRIDWVSAGEGERFARIVGEMTEAVGRLSPLRDHRAVEREVPA
jgi:F420-non-reducing hydrogenase iron-sulfur subunit